MHEQYLVAHPTTQATIPTTKKPGFFEILRNWELWPAWITFSALMPFLLWYMLRARSFWFFTCSNPTIPFGGYEGETKSDIYKQLPDGSYPRTRLVKARVDFEIVKQLVIDAGFQYPFIVKPDIGRKGLLFRKIDTEAQLLEYHNYSPFDYLLQDLIDQPLELGLFYVRHPASKTGKITGLFQRESLEVWGDGISNLRTLIIRHPQAGKRTDIMFEKHAERLDWIPADRERFVLTYAINRSRGARLRNLDHEVDAELTALFDRINLHSGQFFFGRYDIKCNSIEELKKGKNFSILEYNGAGSSPSHIYNCNMSLWNAYKEVLYHIRLLFEISKWNHDHGVPYWPFWKGFHYLRAVNRHLDLLEQYEK